MYAELVHDALTEYAYDADLAGLAYIVSNTAEGLSVSLGGYNDKLVMLLPAVLNKLKHLEVREDRFDILKEQVRALPNHQTR